MVKKMEVKEEEIVMNYDEIGSPDIREDGDEVFKEANQMVEKFKRTTYKFEKKMNLFLNETYFKNKGNERQEMRRSENRKGKRDKW